MEMGESAFMAMQERDDNQAKRKGKGKILPLGGIKKECKCFFCWEWYSYLGNLRKPVESEQYSYL